ncbi:penicillin-binding protein 2 [Halobacteroides halobius DSM 5150]|uniref:Penicillin-binding protein 2 n=1 Tax=Halobacteroides halobius (strain ATCC 35273 / DSM 5150 / MD-1) TaxID=748449 RepID=L0KA69_HALHC|nr:penicillin-binding protein 2 [Halobacteroides halobius]AGB41891.1 penicillin-binding protein 2 [Halobacteroides halobius DSM 5150]
MRENQEEDRRLLLFRILLAVLFVVLVGRLYYLQVYSYQKFKELSKGYRTSVIPIRAPRGKIYDRDKKVLVSNRLAYSVSIIPAEIDKLDLVLKRLDEIINLNVKKTKEKLKNASTNKPIILERDIDRKELILLEENKDEIPGLLIEKTPIREYIDQNFASHVLGYLSEISGAELKEREDYSLGDLIGKTGLELRYEEYLRGKKGKKLIEVNNLGQKVRTLGIKKPTPGYNLVLNLDYQLQKEVEQLLKSEIEKLIKLAKQDKDISQPPSGGAVIITNPKNGSILAMASYPDYNPEQFLTEITKKEWKKLNNSYTQPLLNRAVSTSAPSGSIFKIVTGSASLEELGITAKTKFYDPGYYKTGGVKFRNWYPGGQGEINFVDSIAWSNNTVFFKLGHRLYKKDKTLLQEYAREFGLGDKTQVDLPNEATGLVPGPAWRKKYFEKRENQIWYPGYTINLSIGQGNLRVSPIQLVNLVSAVANGGKLYQPLVVDKIVDSQGKVVKDIKPKLLNEIPVSKSHLKIIKKGMVGVTSYGTARSVFKDIPIKVAGKTGTAQTGRNRPNHGWFAGFAPADDPKIAITVFIEYGASSANTLPIAKGIIKEYFDLNNNFKSDKSAS